MKVFHAELTVVLLLSAAALPVRAQTVPGLDATMTKLFGSNTAFTARATARILDPQEKETMTMPIDYALLDGKIRSEVDMTQVKSKELDGTAAGSLKQMGMDKMTSIVRPDRQSVLVIYPTLRAYAETALPKDTTNAPEDVKIETSKIGNEVVEGQPCQKKKVTITSKSGKPREAVVWNATNLRDFPLRIQMKQPDGTLVMTYSNIKFEKPDPKLFEAPAGFEKYDSVEKMTQTAIMKMLPK
jgi:hypothetical protein